jgi:hypothetical protein
MADSSGGSTAATVALVGLLAAILGAIVTGGFNYLSHQGDMDAKMIELTLVGYWASSLFQVPSKQNTNLFITKTPTSFVGYAESSVSSTFQPIRCPRCLI